MAAPIFRKAALDRLSSPEQLDQLLEVTSPRGWIALVTLLGLCGAAVVWSFVGRIPTRVAGQGILVKKGGLSGISALAAGQVESLDVAAGQNVKKGQRVAQLALPDLQATLDSTRASLATLEAEHRTLSSFGSDDARLKSDAIAQQRLAAQNLVAAARERQATLTGKLATQKKLLEEGLITDQTVQATRDNIVLAKGEMERAQSELKELSVREVESRQRIRQDGSDRQKRLDELKRTIAQMEQKIAANSQVLSPEDGRVIEVRVALGNVVTAGTPLVMLEVAGARDQGLEGILYVSGSDGKKVQPGMRTEVSPSTVKREEYGALKATITSVSAFPSTQAAMLAQLGNPDLVAAFLRAIDTPIEIRVDIDPDPSTKSGFRWTSPEGPPQTVQPGTLCTATITTDEQTPISLVIPMFKAETGL